MRPRSDSGRRGGGPPPVSPVQEEARAIVDAARAAGLTVRVVGGLAALEHCHDPATCRREHRDIDLVAPRREVTALAGLLARFGFEENRHVRLASAGQSAQFFRPCIHGDGGEPLHADDRIDVYLDSFRLHHQVRLTPRLRLHDYAVSASDALLVKLQRGSLGATDLDDVLAMLWDAGLGTGGDQIDPAYIARLCARDWGLGHDVRHSLADVRAAAPARYSGDDLTRVTRVLDELEACLGHERKSLRWRLRALAGERLPWQDVVDEREGVRLGMREGPAGG